jgi:uncharacterized Tic20 family protein
METIKKNPALAFGALYILGVLVTAIHLSRFAIYDLDLTKIRYIFAGAVCSFYLVLRMLLTTIIVDFHVIRAVQKEAHEAVYKNLKDVLIFRIVDKISSVPILGSLLFSYTSKGTARSFIRILSFGALFFIFSTFLFFLSIPQSDAPFSHNLKAALSKFPFYLQILLGVQLAYLLYFYFKPAFQVTEQLKYLWKFVFVLLLLTDIAVYSIAIHPLVKPVFGGGVVAMVNFIPKDKDAADLLSSGAGIKVDNNRSETVLIVHMSDDAYYITTEYALNYLAPSSDEMIRHGKIYRIQKDLVSGYEIVGFR